jgi:hypothetical protein
MFSQSSQSKVAGQTFVLQIDVCAACGLLPIEQREAFALVHKIAWQWFCD